MSSHPSCAFPNYAHGYVAVFALVAMILLGSPRTTRADNVQATFLKIDGASGSYSVPGNWSAGVIPNNTGSIHYDVSLPTAVAILSDMDVTIDNLNAPSAWLRINDHALAIAGNSNIHQIEVNGQNADSSVSLGTIAQYSATSKTLAPMTSSAPVEFFITSYGNHSAALQFNGADIVTNGAQITLAGPHSRLTDENGADALRNLASNPGYLGLGSRSFATKGDLSNDGTLDLGDGSSTTNAAFIINGDLLNFDKATHTLQNGRYELYGTTSQTLQFNDADIVTNATTVSISGANSKIIDQFGNNAFRHFARNAGSFSLGGSNFTIPSDFTNDGTFTLGSHFIVSGNLTNVTNHTLTGGTYYMNSGGTLQFRDADIVTNAASVTLDSGGAMLDQNNNSAFRNLAHNASAASFVLTNTSLVVSGGFKNDGDLTVAGGLPSVLFTPPTLLSVSADFANTHSVTIGQPGHLVLLNAEPAAIQLLAAQATATNSGSIAIGQGGSFTLPASGTYIQTGGSTQFQEGTLTAGTVHIQGGTVTGYGTINANMTFDSTSQLTPMGRPTPSFPFGGASHDGTLTINGSLVLGSSVHTAIAIGGTTAGANNGGYDNLIVHGPVTLSGSLDVSFDVVTTFVFGGGGNPGSGGIIVIGPTLQTTPEYIPSPSDTFTILTATSISGQFDNAPDGSRILMADGFGSFIVHYTADPSSLTFPSPITQVVLSDFQSIPEPATLSLLAVGVTALLSRRRN